MKTHLLQSALAPARGSCFSRYATEALPVTTKAIIFCLLGTVPFCAAEARPGRIDEATIKMRQDVLSRVRFVEVQRIRPNPAAAGGYTTGDILARSKLDEASSRDLIAQFRHLPFERVTVAQCHEPGFALQLLDSDRNPIATISLCWKCHNLQATQDSPQEFREYKEDFAAESKRGMSFRRRLDALVPKPSESANHADQG